MAAPLIRCCVVLKLNEVIVQGYYSSAIRHTLPVCSPVIWNCQGIIPEALPKCWRQMVMTLPCLWLVPLVVMLPPHPKEDGNASIGWRQLFLKSWKHQHFSGHPCRILLSRCTEFHWNFRNLSLKYFHRGACGRGCFAQPLVNIQPSFLQCA